MTDMVQGVQPHISMTYNSWVLKGETGTTMAHYPRLSLATFFMVLSCVEGFVVPGSIPKVGGAFQGQAGLLNTNAQSRCCRRPNKADNVRRNVQGSDGREIDIVRHREAYSFPEYWDEFYAGGEAGDLQDGESYDWFFGYARMAVHLNEHVGGAREGRVLVLGCGNSEISPRMWQDGWKYILNIDFCKPVITAMELAHDDKPGMEWKVMDARDMADLETGSFDAVIDKGLTDSVMYNDNFATMMAKVSFEVARVLKPGGVYVMTDYRDPERVQELFQRDEWEGGSLTQAGKITPTVNLFKGKRSEEEVKSEFAMDTAAIYGKEEDGTDTEKEEEEDAPEWLADAINSGAVSFGAEGEPDLDIPRKDTGQDKPFRF